MPILTTPLASPERGGGAALAATEGFSVGIIDEPDFNGITEELSALVLLIFDKQHQLSNFREKSDCVEIRFCSH
ncbi:MAG: hypothetical protein LUF86_01550 [Clostridiales bacterium]|nr:hypothetical protein [Clostridiales bacterium]